MIVELKGCVACRHEILTNECPKYDMCTAENLQLIWDFKIFQFGRDVIPKYCIEAGGKPAKITIEIED